MMLDINQLLWFAIIVILVAGAVFAAVYFVLNRVFAAENSRARNEILNKSLEISLPLRLQAYERLTLLIERISPDSLVMRLKNQVQTNSDLHLSLLQNIRMEFEHNLSQQIYVSAEIWDKIKETKDEIVTFINDASREVNPQNVSIELSKKIFDNLVEQGKDFTGYTIALIKKEASKHLI